MKREALKFMSLIAFTMFWIPGSAPAPMCSMPPDSIHIGANRSSSEGFSVLAWVQEWLTGTPTTSLSCKSTTSSGVVGSAWSALHDDERQQCLLSSPGMFYPRPPDS